MINLTVVIDNDIALRKFRELQKVAKTTTSSVVSDSERMDAALRKFGAGLAKLGITASFGQLIRHTAQVRGEFQQLEVAFTTLLQSKEKADRLMVEAVKLAATTPFDLQGVANGARQLLAYGFAAEDITDTLTRLGNVAAGLGLPLERLTYLYGTTAVQGRLYARDMLQFTGSGIPLLQEMAKMYGKTTEEINAMVTAGKVGFEDVKKVIEGMTNSGGQFYNLMEEQSKTITGLISNLGDAFDTMFNDIGKSQEGVITNALKGTILLVENYEKVGKILVGLVATYGAYKAAVIAAAAVQKIKNLTENLRLIIMFRKELGLATAAQQAFNLAAKANPYILIGSILVGVIAALISFNKKTDDAALASAELSKNIREETNELDDLFKALNKSKTGTDERKTAIDNINSKYGDYLSNLLSEKSTIEDIAKAYKEAKNGIAEYQIAQSRQKYTENAVNDYDEALSKFNKRLSNWTKELENPEQKARFSAYMSQLSQDLANGGAFTINKVYDAFRAAQAKQTYETVEDFKEAFRSGIEDFGQDDLEIINIIGGLDVNSLDFAGKTLQRTSRDLNTANADFERFAKTYREVFTEETPSTAYSPKNKAYWEGLKKEAEEALAAMDKASKGTKEWIEWQRKLNKATEALKTWNFSDKSSKAEKEVEKRKRALEKLGQELADQQRNNDASEIEAMDEGLQKKLRQIDNDYQARKNEIAKQEADWEQKSKEAGLNGELLDEQQLAIDNANKLNESKRQKAIAETYRAEFNAMQEYLRAYGTYQQQKLAIAEEYAEKIRKASSDSEKQNLGVQRDSLLAGVEAQELRANIDWSVVFGEFGSMFHDLIAPELEKAKAYTQTDEFRNADHDSQEALINAIRQMEQSLGGVGNVSFKKLGADVAAYQKSLSDLKNAQDDYESTYAALSEAQQVYTQSIESGSVVEQNIAKSALDTAQANADAAAENVASMQTAASAAQRTMTDTATTLRGSMDGVVDGLRQIASGSLSGAYEGLIKFGNSAEKVGGKLGNAFGKVADALEDVPVIGWIVQIIDLFKDGLSILVGGLLDAVFNAVSGILSDVLSGDLFVTIGKSLVNGIAGIFDAITFGGFSSWFETSNAREVQATIDRLADRNEMLQTAIEDLTNEIKASKGTKSVAAYKDAYKYQEETNKNYLQIAQAQAGYSGAHHSWGYYWGGFSQAQIDKLSSQIERSWNGNIWNLSPEEMKMLRSNVDMWTQIQNTGKGGYGNRLTDKLNDYIDQAGKLEELTDHLYEGLTGMSFDSMYDSFVDALMDMDASAKDFADNISEYFMRAMLSNKIGETYSDKLKEWWEKFGKAMEDNELTEAERNALQEEYMGYVNDAIKLRDELAAATGYDKINDPERTASSKGIATASQDSVDETNGRLTVIQQHTYDLVQNTRVLADQSKNSEQRWEEMRRYQGQVLQHLAGIEGNTSTLRDIQSQVTILATQGFRIRE